MQDEIIKVTNTESGQTMDVVVLSKHVNKITVVIGKGIHNVQCDLVPTKYKQSYAGSVMGREIVYNRSCDQVQADLDFVNPALKVSRKFKK
jgi:hypothetical protein